MAQKRKRSPRRREFTDESVKALKPERERYTYPDPECLGHYIRVQPSGAKSFAAVARSPFGKQVWTTIESTSRIPIEESRERARTIIKRVKAGQPAIEPPKPAPQTFKEVAQSWIKRHVEAKGLRSRDENVRQLNKYLYPIWGERRFTDIKRSDVALLLDHIEDNNGKRQADLILSIISGIAHWYIARDDDYVVPVTRNMKRYTSNGGRKRIFSEDELKVFWPACDKAGSFGALCRIALTTGQRLAKLLDMRWSDIDADGVWTIRTAPREKGNAGMIKLPELALAVLKSQPRMFGTDKVFASQRSGVRMSASHGVNRLKQHLPADMPQWSPHDLRRTWRSLASRAGVARDHSERVMGHVVPGVEGVYDRHAYFDEKNMALAKVAALIEEIVDGTPAKVTTLRRKAG
jgi:integrase